MRGREAFLGELVDRRLVVADLQEVGVRARACPTCREGRFVRRHAGEVERAGRQQEDAIRGAGKVVLAVAAVLEKGDDDLARLAEVEHRVAQLLNLAPERRLERRRHEQDARDAWIALRQREDSRQRRGRSYRRGRSAAPTTSSDWSPAARRPAAARASSCPATTGLARPARRRTPSPSPTRARRGRPSRARPPHRDEGPRDLLREELDPYHDTYNPLMALNSKGATAAMVRRCEGASEGATGDDGAALAFILSRPGGRLRRQQYGTVEHHRTASSKTRRSGTGTEAVPADRCTVHYTGWLYDEAASRSQGHEVRQLARSQRAVRLPARRRRSDSRVGRGRGRHEGRRPADADDSAGDGLRRARRRRRHPAERDAGVRRRAARRPVTEVARILDVDIAELDAAGDGVATAGTPAILGPVHDSRRARPRPPRPRHARSTSSPRCSKSCALTASRGAHGARISAQSRAGPGPVRRLRLAAHRLSGTASA